ncbi:unnamed protein product [Cuscuta campestris]|uniref:Proteasome assembly chaperone 2 n=1 Tax=Cuscuta campestris TaxID=132261 RepID=A0A484KQV3_9ASTE|nr:unnamed protein product [Cuscuta campestris]
MMEFYAGEGKRFSGNCKTLLLPALSIGNVGQLAVDLFVSSLRADRVGFLDDPNVLPCVGNDAYTAAPPGQLSLPLEVYESSSCELSIIQQRSPVVKGMMVQFARNLADFAAASRIQHIVLLSSLDFGRWQSIDMSSGLQTYYLSSSSLDGKDDECERLGFKMLQEYNPSQRMWKYLSNLAENGEEDWPFEELENEDYLASLPFAALFSCFKAKGVKVTCLMCYCSEGDNIPEAFHLAEAASQLLSLSTKSFGGNEVGKWIVPFSWKSVYGPPSDMSLF